MENTKFTAWIDQNSTLEISTSLTKHTIEILFNDMRDLRNKIQINERLLERKNELIFEQIWNIEIAMAKHQIDLIEKLIINF